MRHYFVVMPSKRRNYLFWILFLLVILMMVVLSWIGAPLETNTAPYGIVSYELAGSKEKSQSILESWDAQAQLAASFSLGLDYLFIPIYACTLALASMWAGDTLVKKSWPLAKISRWLAWGIFLAASLDAVENAALMRQLFQGVGELSARLAQICASLKFGLIFFGLVYVFFALVAHLVSKVTDLSKSAAS